MSPRLALRPVQRRSVAALSATALSGTLAAGDAGVAGAEAGARSAQGALLDLAARLPQR